ncbi:MAG: Na+/phosphate symporter [Paraglaciecola sp.]|jgi:Na+/phosphate symporter
MTELVQSSRAVIVASIGFVNEGLSACAKLYASFMA